MTRTRQFLHRIAIDVKALGARDGSAVYMIVIYVISLVLWWMDAQAASDRAEILRWLFP